MKFKAILFGRSATLMAQTEQLYRFINSNLKLEDVMGSSVLLATRETDTESQLNQASTDKIELVRVSDYQAETILKVLQRLEVGDKVDLYIFPNGALADDIAVRWAYRIKGSSLVQVKAIDRSKTGLRASKATYANHVRATFRMIRKPYCISLAKDGVVPETTSIRKRASIVEHDLSDLPADRQIMSEWVPEESVSDLESTRFLIIGGRGMGSDAACRELEKNALAMGADFGVSRPVAMNAWAPMHRLVGVSGAMTKPDVCIAAAVSGAAALYAGIAHSKKIIAINTNELAPIAKAADVVIIEDYRAVINALVKIVMKEKSKIS